MKNITIIIFYLITSIGLANSQISGQLFQYDSETTPGVQISLTGSKYTTQSNFDGYFELPISSRDENINLVFMFGGLTLEIQNIEPKTQKIELGKLILPEFKSIGIEEYNNLTEPEKENCLPIYCWAELLGYLNTNQLENDYLELNCNDKITDFEYDSKSKKVKVDWQIVKICL